MPARWPTGLPACFARQCTCAIASRIIQILKGICLFDCACACACQVDLAAVLHDVCNLPVPAEWVDPVTQASCSACTPASMLVSAGLSGGCLLLQPVEQPSRTRQPEASSQICPGMAPPQIWPSHISTPYMTARKQAVSTPGGGAAGGDAPGAASPAAGGSRGRGRGREAPSLGEAMEEGMDPPTPSARAQLDCEAAERLVERFPDFFQLYGYA